MRAWSRHGSIFTNTLPLQIRHIEFIYNVQSELSSNFCTELSSNKKVSSKFLCEEDKLLSISKQKTVLLFQQNVFGRVQLPYKSAILWRHFFH